MKSIVNKDTNNTSLPFPKLMASKFHVVLFQSKSAGVVVARLNSEASYKIGQPREDWSPEKFVDFEGSVTLSND